MFKMLEFVAELCVIFIMYYNNMFAVCMYIYFLDFVVSYHYNFSKCALNKSISIIVSSHV